MNKVLIKKQPRVLRRGFSFTSYVFHCNIVVSSDVLLLQPPDRLVRPSAYQLDVSE